MHLKRFSRDCYINIIKRIIYIYNSVNLKRFLVKIIYNMRRFEIEINVKLEHRCCVSFLLVRMFEEFFKNDLFRIVNDIEFLYEFVNSFHY